MKNIFLMLFCLSSYAQDLPRDHVYKALVAAKVLDPDRELVHLSETCYLHLAQKRYLVIDIQELVPSPTSPRGVNRIVILNAAARPVRTISYTTQRPLFCTGNKLFVYGDLKIENVAPEGNVLSFANGGREVSLTHVQANDYPIPVTRERKVPPQ